MPPQLPPQMGGTQQPAQSQPLPPAPNRKNPLPIIDPTTGKNILDGLNQESVTPPRSSTLHEKETENADPNICVQFATQVAAALANNDKTDMPAKAAPIVETRVIPEPQMCPVEPPEEETYQSRSRPEPFYEIDTSIPVEEYREESPSPVRIEPELVPEPDPPACEEEVCQEEEPVVEAEDMTPVLDSPQEKSVGFVSVQELNKVNAQLAMDMVNVSQEATAPPTPVVESYKEPPPIIEEKVETITIVNSTKPAEKLSSIESKKNKTRKKKDLNKKGESKEGGEMDAFLDKGPEEERVPPMVEEQRPHSPVPVVDSDILDSIPLPPEPAPSPPNGEKASEDKENSHAEDAASKLILKYEYKEDQWSPLNPEGKKQYDRDFLLQLQGEPMSLCKPSNLPNLDVIKDKAHIQRLTEVNRVTPMTMPMKAYNDPFVPTYARGGAQRPVTRRVTDCSKVQFSVGAVHTQRTSVILQQDNARPPVAQLTHGNIAKMGWEQGRMGTAGSLANARWAASVGAALNLSIE
ncbi:eukaryotic translation initiation factor 4 gamma 1-like [Uloborus diversus]|uniref:eukaryotic translation initiation factor 4 gamma 1-like n=1 Tax=Uloborus diversus TaxID=327109 RepID=UPI0024096A8F|nr:eukaryotic translation initiation factor 4 gamma 1-like [Uloborus diversus]